MEKNNKKTLPESDYKNFSLFFLFWLGFGFLAFFSSIFGIFSEYIFKAYIIFGLSFLFRSIQKKHFKISQEMSIFYSAMLVIILLVSVFSTPTIFSGRDQGSISEAAIRLAQNHQLEFSTSASQEFFKIYGPGKALNFPGFYYTEKGNLITQFPLAYISWLASFFSLLGMPGLIFANALLFFLFSSSFYLLWRMFIPRKCAAMGMILLLTNFSFFWITKFTLTENMALALLWFSILNLTAFVREPRKLTYWSFFLSSALLVFTRIEGIVLFTFGFLPIFFSQPTREYLKKNIFKLFIFPALLFLIVFFINFNINLGFYKEIAKAIFGSTQNSIIDIDTVVSFWEKYIYPAFYSLKIYLLYGLLGIFAAGTAGIFYFFRKRNYLILTPLFVITPMFIYLIDSNISSDHPWMLRRFVFSILPAFIFYTITFLSELRLTSKKKIRLIGATLFIILLGANIPALVRHIGFLENKNLLAQTKEISQNFSGNDLILIDRLASGDGWAMVGSPMNFLFGKNSVYFFNPQDLDKLNLEKFDRIYLITPQESLDFYQSSTISSRMRFWKNYSLQTQRLENNEDNKNLKLEFANKKYETVSGIIFEIKK